MTTSPSFPKPSSVRRVPTFKPLTTAETLVAELVAGGFTVQQVAEGMLIARNTVRVHVARASAKIPGTLPALNRIVTWWHGGSLDDLHRWFDPRRRQNGCRCDRCAHSQKDY